MEKGFNSDIELHGNRYHIQTEDWGLENPCLVSSVYQNGAVLKSIKTAYAEILPEDQLHNPQVIRMAMKIQHHKILDLLNSGQLFSRP